MSLSLDNHALSRIHCNSLARFSIKFHYLINILSCSLSQFISALIRLRCLVSLAYSYCANMLNKSRWGR